MRQKEEIKIITKIEDESKVEAREGFVEKCTVNANTEENSRSRSEKWFC